MNGEAPASEGEAPPPFAMDELIEKVSPRDAQKSLEDAVIGLSVMLRGGVEPGVPPAGELGKPAAVTRSRASFSRR